MSTKTIYGLYDDDDVLLDAIKSFNAKGISIKEVYTPFPIHGLDKALGLKKTRISDLAFFYGVYGVTLASVMTWYMMNHDWPQNIGGKPSFTWFENMPAFVTIMFEMTVFCAAHFMTWTYMIRNGFYPGSQPQNPDPRTTDDKFMIEVESADVDKVKDAFIDTGAEEVTVRDLVKTVQ